MALEKVVESIRDQGRSQSARQVEEAQKEAAAILADAEKQAASIREKRARELETAVESLKRREAAAAELESKKSRLNAEKDVLAKVRAGVLDRLSKLTAEKRVAHIQALLRTSSIANGTLLVAERDADAARKAGLTVGGTVNAVGGAVVVAADGSTREDLTYETILDEVWGPSLHSVADSIFGKVK